MHPQEPGSRSDQAGQQTSITCSLRRLPLKIDRQMPVAPGFAAVARFASDELVVDSQRTIRLRPGPFGRPTKNAGRALVVDNHELFHHCAKAFLRSHLWRPDSWTDPLPSRAVIARTLGSPEQSLEGLIDYYGPAYAE